MAINIPILTEFSDKGVKAAKAAFANFKTSVADAQGGMNKFKAGSKSAMDAVSANAGAFAIAGGIAFAKFAAAGIDAFQTLAIESGKFADATGLAVEDASRWKEVADDIGIGSDTIQTGIGKMNKVLGTTPGLFNDLGIEVATTDGLTTDVNGTFLNVIEKLKGIKDPAEKAKVATQLLGKGWQGMAELINVGSAGLQASLKGVSDAKVINPAELQRAKDYRAAQDNLRDAFEEISITVGEDLVPALTTAIDNLVKIANAKIGGTSIFGTLVTSAKYAAYALIEGPAKAMRHVHDDAVVSTNSLDNNSRALRRQATAAAKIVSDMSIAQLAAQVALLEAPLKIVTYEWEKLTGALSETVEIDKAKQQVKDLGDAAAKAFTSGSQEDLAAYHQLLLDATTSIAALAGGLDIVSNKAIKIKVDAGDLEGALALIELIKGNAVLIGKAADIARASGQGLHIPGRASGGPVSAGQTYMVGERGVELFTPSTAGTITPNGGMGGGNTITINVSGGDPMQVVKALQTYVRTIGPVPVNTRTM